MPNRIVSDSLLICPRFNALSMGAQILYWRLITTVDDHGRFYGSPITILGSCWPLNPEKLRIKDVRDWLAEMERGEHPMVRTYSSGGAAFLELQNFPYQARSLSRFPDPPWAKPFKIQALVYFIQGESSKRIKIGFTEASVRTRLSTLQIGSSEPLRIIGTFQGTLDDEREAHEAFAADNVSGEWFQETPRLLKFIADKCNGAAGL